MIEKQIIKIGLDDPSTTGRNISYITQRVGTGDDAGLTSAPHGEQVVIPGHLIDSTDEAAIDGKLYVRTVLTELPEEIRNIAQTCYTEAVYTAHEAKLRS